VCPPNSEVENSARRRGLEVHPLSLEPRSSWANAKKLAALMERYPVELINSQSARDREALTRLALSGRLRVPLVATRRQMPRTFFLANWLTSRLAVVIPNGLITDRVDRPVTEDALESWRQRTGWEPSRRTIGIVARPKDQAVVLRSLELVSVPVRLVLAGVDPKEELGKLARKVPERHRVVCLPFDPEVRPLYELLELVLLPSRSEGLSQGLLEAMALGKPVIASAATGNLEVVTDGVDGRLVAPQDPVAWAVAIERLLTDAPMAHAMGNAARITARERFALSHTIERTIALYRLILNR
jgi:glycosyltransferase involved in cell wall biosynthesis